MAEAKVTKPPPKRRRVLDPSAIVPVPVYSNKVKSSLQLKPTAALLTEQTNSDDDTDDSLLSGFSSRAEPAHLVTLSDSEDEHVQRKAELEAPRCPSPPPPESPVKKQSRKVRRKLSEIDRKLRAVSSLLSPPPQGRRSRRCRGPPIPHPEEEQLDTDSDNDDIIIVSPEPESSPYSSSVREIPLKVRCRTEVHKIPVLSSAPLSDVLTQLSDILNVPPPRLLLLREEEELPASSTVGELGLGIADIIECVVMAPEDRSQSGGSGVITVKLQSKDRDSCQEFSLHREAPLRSVFVQYLSKMSGRDQTMVRFHFDGSKVTGSQTPAQLDMEDGDIVEVWV